MPTASGRSETTPLIRQLICEQAQAGVPLLQLALVFQRPLRTTQHIVKTRADTADYENAPRTGRPQKINERSLRHLSRIIHHNRRQSLANITHSINAALPVPVTPATVRDTLKNRLGISQRITAKKPFINPAQQQKWLLWAKEHLHWTMEDWEQVIWTNESSVKIGKESRECVVWRKVGERYKQDCLVPTFKSGRSSIMIWGCISYGMRGPLVRMPPHRRNGIGYVQLILAGLLWDHYIERYEELGVVKVMEDGAPVHWCKLAHKFRTENAMETISHPPQSPDLNPIKHGWKRLKVLVNERPIRPKDKEELWTALQEEWQKIDVDFINALIDSMAHRVQTVYDAHGHSTKY